MIQKIIIWGLFALTSCAMARPVGDVIASICGRYESFFRSEKSAGNRNNVLQAIGVEYKKLLEAKMGQSHYALYAGFSAHEIDEILKSLNDLFVKLNQELAPEARRFVGFEVFLG